MEFTKTYFKYSLFVVVFLFFASVLLILAISRTLVTNSGRYYNNLRGKYNNHNNYQPQQHKYKYIGYDHSTKEISVGITRNNGVFENDIFYQSSEDKYSLLTNLDGIVYTCTGSCFCMDDDFDFEYERRSAFSKSISKSLVFMVSAVTSVIAYNKASEYFDEACRDTMLSSENLCTSSSSIRSEVGQCDILQSEVIEKEELDEEVETKVVEDSEPVEEKKVKKRAAGQGFQPSEKYKDDKKFYDEWLCEATCGGNRRARSQKLHDYVVEWMEQYCWSMRLNFEEEWPGGPTKKDIDEYLEQYCKEIAIVETLQIEIDSKTARKLKSQMKKGEVDILTDHEERIIDEFYKNHYKRFCERGSRVKGLEIHLCTGQIKEKDWGTLKCIRKEVRREVLRIPVDEE